MGLFRRGIKDGIAGEASVAWMGQASAEAARRGDAAGAAEALGFELRDPPPGGGERPT